MSENMINGFLVALLFLGSLALFSTCVNGLRFILWDRARVKALRKKELSNPNLHSVNLYEIMGKKP